MTNYPRMMNTLLEHIEQHLDDRLSVDDLAGRCGYSSFHFARMFRACVGTSVKQYVLQRKLAEARRRLLSGRPRVIDIAMDLGFESPEVFSRAFRRAFGVSPSQAEDLAGGEMDAAPARIVERDISNWRGLLLPDAELENHDSMELFGVHAEVDVARPSWATHLQQEARGFLHAEPESLGLAPEQLFLVVRCLGAPDGSRFHVFHGRRAAAAGAGAGLARFDIPGGCWAAFSYRGDLLEIRETIEDDLYRWIASRGLIPRPDVDVGMLVELPPDYETSHAVRLRIPLVPGG